MGMDKRLMQIADFKVRPGLKNYHYAALATVDKEGRPYVRLRSPTVQRNYDALKEDLESKLSSKHSRMKPEDLKTLMKLDEEYKDVLNKRQELILFLEEYGNPDHVKLTLDNLEMHNQCVLVCLETQIIMTERGRPSNPRIVGTDAIIDAELAEVYEPDHPYYQYRKKRYMVQLADFHLGSYKPENREKRFDESIQKMFTLKAIEIHDFEHRFEHPQVIPKDQRLDDEKITAEFINQYSCGVLAAIDHEDRDNKVTAIPAESFAVLEYGDGIFIEIDMSQPLGEAMYRRIQANVKEHKDPFISFTVPAMGMGAEIGVSYDGKVIVDGDIISNVGPEHKKYENTEIIYLDPTRITDLSTAQTRRGRIIYSHFKDINWPNNYI